MRIYVRRARHLARYSPSPTAQYRAHRRILAHLLGGVVFLLLVILAFWELAGGFTTGR